MTNKLKGSFYSYFGAIVSMAILFLVTNYNHEGQIDAKFFIYSLFDMAWLAIPSGILGFIFSKLQQILKFILGIIVGPITAAIYLYIMLY